MGRKYRRERERWLVVLDGRVIDRIYDCALKVAHRMSLQQHGGGARLTAWRYASAELRTEALRVPIRYPDQVAVLAAHFERPRAMSAGGGR